MQLQGWEAVLFYVLAIGTLFMGVYVVTARIAVHSALCLISTLVNVALLFILLRAEFVAGVQILVYVGGVMVLFLFVIMLVQTRAEEEDRVKLYTGQMYPAFFIALLFAAAFFFAMNPAQAAARIPATTFRRPRTEAARTRRTRARRAVRRAGPAAPPPAVAAAAAEGPRHGVRPGPLPQEGRPATTAAVRAPAGHRPRFHTWDTIARDPARDRHRPGSALPQALP